MTTPPRAIDRTSRNLDKPVLLDLYCCEGGAGKGYHLAGFDVIGVDIEPQPRYPFTFHQGDALALLPALVREYRPVAVHASPPCHDHTSLTSVAGTDGTAWLLAATRDALDGLGLPYVLENVPGAPMCPDLILCGAMFGLRTYRHRWFELGGWWAMSPGHPQHTALTATRQRRDRWDQGWNVSITGDVGVYVGPEAMGIDWMSGDGLSQAIPPAYTRWIGEQLLADLTAGVAA